MIELYTSEGCSRCPAADRWLSQLKNDPKLWLDKVPIAFHVDYWDYIGWKDSLAFPGNTQRQGWFDKQTVPEQKHPKVGILKAEIKGNSIDINYLGATQPLEYHIAVLGFDIQSQVKAGENTGRTLTHDFVALSHDSVSANNNQASLNLAKSGRFNVGRRAIAIWVNGSDTIKPIQCIGGWLP